MVPITKSNSPKFLSGKRFHSKASPKRNSSPMFGSGRRVHPRASPKRNSSPMYGSGRRVHPTKGIENYRKNEMKRPDVIKQLKDHKHLKYQSVVKRINNAEYSQEFEEIFDYLNSMMPKKSSRPVGGVNKKILLHLAYVVLLAGSATLTEASRWDRHAGDQSRNARTNQRPDVIETSTNHGIGSVMGRRFMDSSWGADKIQGFRCDSPNRDYVCGLDGTYVKKNYCRPVTSKGMSSDDSKILSQDEINSDKLAKEQCGEQCYPHNRPCDWLRGGPPTEDEIRRDLEVHEKVTNHWDELRKHPPKLTYNEMRDRARKRERELIEEKIEQEELEQERQNERERESKRESERESERDRREQTPERGDIDIGEDMEEIRSEVMESGRKDAKIMFSKFEEHVSEYRKSPSRPKYRKLMLRYHPDKVPLGHKGLAEKMSQVIGNLRDLRV